MFDVLSMKKYSLWNKSSVKRDVIIDKIFLSSQLAYWIKLKSPLKSDVRSKEIRSVHNYKKLFMHLVTADV